MNKNNFWETIVWIIISTFILSFVLLWITNLLVNSKTTFEKYNEIKDINTIKNNTLNILWNINVDLINKNEEFYIYKNKTINKFEIFTWSTHNIYQYVDSLWNNINEMEFAWSNIYSRVVLLERKKTILWETFNKFKINVKRYIEN